MSQTEPLTAVPEPERSGFQFSLQTLLLLFVVLGSSLAVFGAWGIVVFAIIVGLAVYLHQGWPLVYLALVVLCLMCLICLLPSVQSAREASRRGACMNNLKQLSLALLNYYQANGCFPPAYIADKNGKPMHSWRVLILPYLGQTDLYKTYDFTEPWDGANNKKLLSACPREYQCPNNHNVYAPGATQTDFVAVVGPNAAWTGEKPMKLDSLDFAGRTSNTAMLIEADNSGIQWTEPRDLVLNKLGIGDAKAPLDLSRNHYRREEFFYSYDRYCGATVAMADSSVHFLPPPSLSVEHLRTILQANGYREDELIWGDVSYDEERRLNWPNIAALAVWLLSVGMLLARAVRSRKVRPPSAAVNNSGGKEIFQSEDS
jgi:hypothetical protein